MAKDKKPTEPARVLPIEPDPPARRAAPAGLVWVVVAWLALLPAADLALHLSSRLAAGNEITADRARFAVVNALTLTGFRMSIGVESYPLPAQVVLYVLTLLGAVFPMVVGGMAVSRILGMRFTDAQIIRSTLGWVAGLSLIAGLLLTGGNRTPFSAMFLGASAVANSGLHVGQLPELTDWRIQLVIIPASVIGSLGITVLMELSQAMLRVLRNRGPAGDRPGLWSILTPHARLTLAWTAGIYLAGAALLIGLQWIHASTDEAAAPGAMTRWSAEASLGSANTRSLGLSLVEIDRLPRTAQAVVVVLMLVGGGSASTAGGLKVSTLAALWQGTRRSLQGVWPDRSFASAVTWVAGYLAVVLVGVMVILECEPQLPTDRVIFEVASALGNVGLSLSPITVVGPGLDTMSALMLLGRLLPLGVLWWMARSSSSGQQIAVG